MSVKWRTRGAHDILSTVGRNEFWLDEGTTTGQSFKWSGAWREGRSRDSHTKLWSQAPSQPSWWDGTVLYCMEAENKLSSMPHPPS